MTYGKVLVAREYGRRHGQRDDRKDPFNFHSSQVSIPTDLENSLWVLLRQLQRLTKSRTIIKIEVSNPTREDHNRFYSIVEKRVLEAESEEKRKVCRTPLTTLPGPCRNLLETLKPKIGL